MLSNLTIKNKLFLGFGLAILLLLTISIIGYRTIIKSTNNFHQYTITSEEEVIVAQLETNILLNIMQVHKYISNGKKEHLDTFNKKRERVEGLIKKALTLIRSDERKKEINQLSDILKNYVIHFDESIKHTNNKIRLVDEEIVPIGNKLLEDLQKLVKFSSESSTPVKTYRSSLISNNMILIRLRVARYLEEPVKSRANEIKNSLLKIKEDLSYITKDIEDPYHLQLIKNCQKGVKSYTEIFKQVNQESDKIQEIVYKDLSSLGVKIEEKISNLTSSLLEEQKNLSLEIKNSNSKGETFIIIASIMAIMVCLGFAFVIANGITKHLSKAVEALKDIAQGEGDLTQRLNFNSKDEIGLISKWFNAFLEKLQNSMSQIGGTTQELTKFSNTMKEVSNKVKINAEETSSKGGIVSGATEEINTNISTVASASEEMSSTIAEISQNTTTAAEISNNLSDYTVEATSAVNGLSVSSNEISEVISLIESIAEQTNLLALNATIESARAGEAGKGFAVVANEVKELAKETGNATEEIAQKIKRMQDDTKTAVSAIEEMKGVVEKIASVSHSTAGAVEEQSVTTNEMTRNITEIEMGSREILDNISGVTEAARNTLNLAKETEDNSLEISNVAEDLKGMLSKFKY